ncbi:alpha/beta hydrolase [Streptococcus intermedius]|uniref:alpha/beta hydrolase n=1 Tax=Streptococcus intermedius TaxID=1338 RepID=UPI00025B858E|nr:alpha/beta hydrolase family protein [Streptococcus intermedius]EID83313.1 putative esterase [Streptococcus intermedius SK54 = ATCC 27335]
MAFFEIEYHSTVLEMERRVNVIYPDADAVEPSRMTDTDIPVLYLLHGMGGNENSWRKRTNIERLLRHTNLIVIMPSTDLAWYTNTTYGLKYYDAIAKELPEVMQRFFPNMSRKREKTFIAGLSMGGYGAYKIALTTDQFSYAGSFSGFGDLKAAGVEQHFLTTMAKKSDKRTKFYAWCGEQDFLYQANEIAVKKLRECELDITYHHAPGKHEWYYWEKQLEKFLKWLPIGFEVEERLS